MQKIRALLIIIIILITNCSLFSQNSKEIRSEYGKNSFDSYESFKKELFKITSVENEKLQNEQIDILWKWLKENHQIPFTFNDTAAFLYRGDAASVSFQGDFTGWGSVKNIKIKAEKTNKSNIWLLECKFPSDARIDYKIVLNDTNWILDPDNKYTQMSGFGPNSELRMPKWTYPKETIRLKGIPAGSLSDVKSIKSDSLGYEVNYRVYAPENYTNLKNLPVIYVSDGHEFSDDEKGSMVIILDNLIAKKKIKPVIAVFIDPREPGKPQNNRRESEFLFNDKYAAFITKELVPKIDKEYRTIPSPDNRAILGTSYGGVLTTYFGVTRVNTFHLIAIMSPAYWRVQKLYDMYKNSEKLPLKIFLSTGTINDGELLTRGMKALFEKTGYPILYKEVSQGHSWGNWRCLLDDMLLYFYGN
jgi:enterochelin esterase-like enzyme